MDASRGSCQRISADAGAMRVPNHRPQFNPRSGASVLVFASHSDGCGQHRRREVKDIGVEVDPSTMESLGAYLFVGAFPLSRVGFDRRSRS